MILDKSHRQILLEDYSEVITISRNTELDKAIYFIGISILDDINELLVEAGSTEPYRLPVHRSIYYYFSKELAMSDEDIINFATNVREALRYLPKIFINVNAPTKEELLRVINTMCVNCYTV